MTTDGVFRIRPLKVSHFQQGIRFRNRDTVVLSRSAAISAMSRLDDLAHALAGLGTRLHDQRVVARPRDVEEVAACVRAANGAKCSVSVVGGNWSEKK